MLSKIFEIFFGKAAILGVQNEAFCAMSEGVNSDDENGSLFTCSLTTEYTGR